MKPWLLALALLAALSCESTSNRAVEEDIKKGDYDAASKKLDQRRAEDPDSFPERLANGEEYYMLARKSLDDDKQSDYVQYLRKAQTEFLAAAKLEPSSPQPHTWIGIITAYQGDLKGSEVAFRNALRLATKDRYGQGPQGVPAFYYGNLAQIEVYLGDVQKARQYIDKAEKHGGGALDSALPSVLLAWKTNDMVEARDTWNGAALLDPNFTTTFDMTPLPKKMESFDDFAEVCCKNPTCGPYMEHGCARERHAVEQRKLDAETVKKQLEVERERRAKLKEIYEKNRSLDVQIEADPNAPAPAPSGQSAPAPKAPATTPAKKSAP